MIKRMSHATIFVSNQEEALNFYRDKLGFAVHTGMLMDEATATQLRAIIDKGVLGAGAFHTDDCHTTYQELKSRGVEFVSEPAERPYGIEAVFKDNSGNWFSLTQPNEENT